jgi:hypothetical protein
MAKNKTGLVIGLAVAAGAAFLLLKRPAAPGTTTTATAPSYPGGTTPAPAPNTTAGLINSLISLGKSIFGGSASDPSFAPVSLAPTSSGAGSPAGGINYINPTAPTLAITAPAPDTTTWNPNDYGLGDLFA